MRFLRAHVSEFILGLTSFILGLLFILIKGQDEPVGYIIAAVGLQLSTALFLLKNEIYSKLDEKLEVYRLLGAIHYPELQEHAHEAIENCKTSLRQLAEGKIRNRADLIFHSIAEKVMNAKREVLAVHVGWTVKHMEAWNDPHMSNYYEVNLNAVKRNVRVRRIFILHRGELVNPETDKLYEGVTQVLNKQKQDGIDVMIAWDHVIEEKGIIQDWIMIDKEWVEYGMDAGGFVSRGWSDKDAFLSVNPRKLKEYRNKFRMLERYTAKWSSEGTKHLSSGAQPNKSFEPTAS